MNPTYRNCRDCAAWNQDRTTEDGECRRFAPRLPKKDYYKLWPLTSPRDGCFDSLPKDLPAAPTEVARK